MYFDWSNDKNEQIKKERGVGFEDVVQAFEDDRVLDIVKLHNPKTYQNQRLFIVELNGYTHYVPFVTDNDRYFLKNIISSRKLHKKYKG